MKLNSILKNFRKTINQLDSYIVQADKEIHTLAERIHALNMESLSHRNDRDKATRVRDKLASLISDE